MVATARVKSLHTTLTFIIHIASIEKFPSDLDSALKNGKNLCINRFVTLLIM